tara:strand:+ start:2616 stop:2816 length:201 start_codon:yes stop_codon:yes gene_type:complete
MEADLTDHFRHFRLGDRDGGDMAMNLMALLDDSEAVQERLDNGQYGYCLETGKPIDIERMLANPIA